MRFQFDWSNLASLLDSAVTLDHNKAVTNESSNKQFGTILLWMSALLLRKHNEMRMGLKASGIRACNSNFVIVSDLPSLLHETFVWHHSANIRFSGKYFASYLCLIEFKHNKMSSWVIEGLYQFIVVTLMQTGMGFDSEVFWPCLSSIVFRSFLKLKTNATYKQLPCDMCRSIASRIAKGFLPLKHHISGYLNGKPIWRLS